MMNTMLMTKMMAEDCGVPELRSFCERKNAASKKTGLKHLFQKLLGK
ncbi:MAG: hypothetical protein IJK38_13015 [Oscillospiraceae bacterium]|nr:hypothetical protein [Oscillospiraceae bacterium]